MPSSPVECPSCGHTNPEGSSFCNRCGLPVHFETCPNCEAINDRSAGHCHKCGVALTPKATIRPPAKRTERPVPPPPASVHSPAPEVALPLPSVIVEPGASPAGADSPPPRGRPVRPIFVALLLLALAAAGYLVYADPERLRAAVDAIGARW